MSKKIIFITTLLTFVFLSISSMPKKDVKHSNLYSLKPIDKTFIYKNKLENIKPINHTSIIEQIELSLNNTEANLKIMNSELDTIK